VPLHITVSVGVSSFPAHADGAQALVAAADVALYVAKQGDKNRVITYEPKPGHAAHSEVSARMPEPST